MAKLNTKQYTNVSHNGSGMWWMLHMDARNATTDLLKQAFLENVKYKATNFGCMTCRIHFVSAIANDPPDKYWSPEYGYFKWTHKLHNIVNRRLNKAEIPFDEAWSYFEYPSARGCTNCNEKQEAKMMDDEIPPAMSLFVKGMGWGELV